MHFFLLLQLLFINQLCTSLNLQPNRPSFSPKLPLQNNNNQIDKRIVIIAGFESFNLQLYKRTADIVMKSIPNIQVDILTDVDITTNPQEVDDKLSTCSVLFCSLIFDYAQVQWLLPKITNIPVKFMFESAQELMSETIVGEFTMRPKDGNAPGPPPAVKKLLKQFGSAKEEDKMAGYINLLKIGPQFLKLIPQEGFLGDKVKDVRRWLTVYSYWNQGTQENIVSMLYYIIDTFSLSSTSAPQATSLIEAPSTAFYHPALYETQGYIQSRSQYVDWYEKTHTWVNKDTPRVGVLLYKKHVLSDQAYIGNMLTLMETQGIMPIPVFITGVEAHVIVRDVFITLNEIPNANYIRYMQGDRVLVDAIVNTIG